MVYRIHFTLQDLARTRVSETPLPLLELELAVRALQDRSQPARLDAWRRQARAGMSAQARMALSLMPAVGSTPDFLSPTEAGTPEDVLEHVRATSPRQIQADLADAAEHRSLPTWARHLADDVSLFHEVCTGLSELHASLLGPLWPQLTADFMADRTVRSRHLLTGGVERLLAQANPQWMRWNPPVLEVRMINGADRDLHLEGEGIVLVPSAFCARTIVISPAPFFLTYPALHDQPLRQFTALSPEAEPASAAAVPALLGRTRAAVLTAIAEHPGCSTKELATLTATAPASASEHATVLREAGLIRTLRHRNTALHSPTPLGLALLNARP
ncbi:winged helix-turn-helix domain-containing protein [Streptomyces sp. NPDC048696]|uniref:winged helix-turn-helix domain-containing protein n=1 Tax=Streptomyces sp. NPDC048696 TaxID=3365585 RepID=UPI003713D934